MWVANERMTSRFSLAPEMPASLKDRMERIQEKREQSRRSRYEVSGIAQCVGVHFECCSAVPLWGYSAQNAPPFRLGAGGIVPMNNMGS